MKKNGLTRLLQMKTNQKHKHTKIQNKNSLSGVLSELITDEEQRNKNEKKNKKGTGKNKLKKITFVSKRLKN